jgi:hypothetical protein
MILGLARRDFLSEFLPRALALSDYNDRRQ